MVALCLSMCRRSHKDRAPPSAVYSRLLVRSSRGASTASQGYPPPPVTPPSDLVRVAVIALWTGILHVADPFRK